MIHIHKEIYGQGEPIVLIHGWAMHTGVWRLFAQQLAKYNRVICLDLPGHGLSESIEPYTLEQMCKALIQVIPDSTFSVLGWSLGASVAITMAIQFPDRVKRLILVAGNPRFIKCEGWSGVNPDLLADFRSNIKKNDRSTLTRFLSLQVSGLPESKGLLKQLKTAMQECELPSQTVLQNGLNILQSADLRDDFSALQCQITSIQGDKDVLIPEQVSQDMQRIQSACKINIIPQAGHVSFLSHPSLVIEIIKSIE